MAVEDNCVYKAMIKLLPLHQKAIFELCDQYKRDDKCLVLWDALIATELERMFEVTLMMGDFKKIDCSYQETGYLLNELKKENILLVSISGFSDEEFENVGHVEAFLSSDLETQAGIERVNLIENYLSKYGGVIFFPKLN